MSRKDLTFDPTAHASIQAPLARFVFKNFHEFGRIRNDAGEGLKQATGRTSFHGYDAKSSKLVDAQCCALYKRIAALGLSYRQEARPLAHSLQRVRLADEVLAKKEGCCIDLVLLLAGVVAEVGIYPLVVIVGTNDEPSHALLGYWTSQHVVAAAHKQNMILLPQELCERRPDLKFIDCTWRETPDSPLQAFGDYVHAVESASRYLSFGSKSEGQVFYAVDIEACWRSATVIPCNLEPDFEPFRTLDPSHQVPSLPPVLSVNRQPPPARSARLSRLAPLSLLGLALMPAGDRMVVPWPADRRETDIVLVRDAGPVQSDVTPPYVPPKPVPSVPGEAQRQGPPAVLPAPALAGAFVGVGDSSPESERLRNMLIEALRDRIHLRGSDAVALVVVRVRTRTTIEEPFSELKSASLTGFLEWKNAAEIDSPAHAEEFSISAPSTTEDAAVTVALRNLASRMATRFLTAAGDSVAR